MLKEVKPGSNMYDWVTHIHNHLGGACPHKCSYCYVQRNRYGVNPRYQGPVHLINPELNVDYGEGKIIFIEYMNDLFAEAVLGKWVAFILQHCNNYPNNTYVIQTKNPKRALAYAGHFPPHVLIGTTIETNRPWDSFTPKTWHSNAPLPQERYEGILALSEYKRDGERLDTFITVEPIMDFDVDILGPWIAKVFPRFVNIGADSKGCKLPEPGKDKIAKLIAICKAQNIEIKRKTNLNRLFFV